MNYIRDNKPIGENFISFISSDQLAVTGNDTANAVIVQIGNRIDGITNLVYEYTNLSDPTLDTDDEIINWTFPDVNYDLISAAWNLYSCLFKTCASNLRNAFEMSFLSLYFQSRQNIDKLNGVPGYNKYFSEWDRGERPTPNWGEMKSIVKQNVNILAYNSTKHCDIIDEVYSWYGYLCNFTHGKPFENSISNAASKPTNHMNIGTGFDIDNFKRFSKYLEDTISWIATFWSLSFPEILKSSQSKYNSLFKGQRGVDVLNYVTSEI